jgi:hypothetical protein
MNTGANTNQGGFSLGMNNKKAQGPSNDGDDLFATNRPMYKAKRNF